MRFRATESADGSCCLPILLAAAGFSIRRQSFWLLLLPAGAPSGSSLSVLCVILSVTFTCSTSFVDPPLSRSPGRSMMIMRTCGSEGEVERVVIS